MECVDVGLLKAEWDISEAAVGEYLLQDTLKDYIGRVSLTDGEEALNYGGIPVLTLVHMISWGVAQALFSGKYGRVNLVEYGPVCDIEISQEGILAIRDGGCCLRYNLLEFCGALGKLETEILLQYIEGPDDLAGQRVLLGEHFVGGHVLDTYLDRER